MLRIYITRKSESQNDNRLANLIILYLHGRTTVRSGAGTPQVPRRYPAGTPQVPCTAVRRGAEIGLHGVNNFCIQILFDSVFSRVGQ